MHRKRYEELRTLQRRARWHRGQLPWQASAHPGIMIIELFLRYRRSIVDDGRIMAAAEFDAEELTVLIWLGSARGCALTHGESSWSLY